MMYTMSNDDQDPIWSRPEPAGRKPRFSREQIGAAALRIADDEGFAAVTMKRIASELGASTMTLYYYVRTKADVVALMQDAILAEVLVPEAELRSGWRAATAAIARRTRQVMIAHPWSPMSLDDSQFGPNAMRHMEQSLAALTDTKLSTAAKFALVAAVDDYVLGNAMHAIEAAARTAAAEADPGSAAATVAFALSLLETGEFPVLQALYTAQSEADPADTQAQAISPGALAENFERGLGALLDGLAARLGI
jgi:AcrR family transcriptional regulator